MNKIIKIFKNDIIFSPQDTAESLEKACYINNKNFVVTGICDFSADFVFVIMEEAEVNISKRTYIFSPMQGISEDDFINTVNTRYYADFSTIGGFFIEDKLWGLFYTTKQIKRKI